MEAAVSVEDESETPGLIGTAVIAGRTTELVDIDYHLREARSGRFRASEGTRGGGNGHAREACLGPRVLLVDDSPFFLRMLEPVLRSEGFDVTLSHDGHHAIARLERGETFDAIVSDIDMPHMDGFELARRVRCSTDELPLIALTARDSDADRAHGMQVGFDQYLKKFDEAEVIAALRAGTAGVRSQDEIVEVRA